RIVCENPKHKQRQK
ncbi:MAG: 50S ribosomal protein L36, partial [Spirochaetales bacterium]|nr:50S ribosomal protein L36 [Spirochaetales bacterium]